MTAASPATTKLNLALAALIVALMAASLVVGPAGISPRTAIAFPVEWNVRLGLHEWRLVPLFDDQENDTRASTGAIYWEGAVRAEGGPSPGRGYLELTGYGQPLRLR